MNTYYSLIQHLKTTFEEDAHVNTVLTGDFEQWRADMFPIVHLEVQSYEPAVLVNTSVVRYNVLISVLNIRDFNKEDTKDKFWFNDNRHDSWNTTQAILRRAENKLIKDHLDTDITLESSTQATKQTWVYMNGLDGWEQTWTIDVPDTLSTICAD